MARIALGIEYDGRHFCGWQVQPDTRTVQADVEAALARVAAAPISTICAGRTDSGVHALCQIVHFDSDSTRSDYAWCAGSNAHLGDDVAVRWARRVDESFHARFGALSRRYVYLVLNDRVSSPLYRARAYWERRPLDAVAMQEAARILVGEHDFSAFRAASCQAANPRRIVSAIAVRKRGPWLQIEIEANAFLQNMVRIIVGSLLRIGRAEADADWLAAVLAGRDRRHRGATAPPQGLYLTGVDYQLEYGLPAAPAVADFLPGGT